MTNQEAFDKALELSKTGRVSVSSGMTRYFSDSLQKNCDYDSFAVHIDGVCFQGKSFEDVFSRAPGGIEAAKAREIERLEKELARAKGITGNAKLPPGVEDGRD